MSTKNQNETGSRIGVTKLTLNRQVVRVLTVKTHIKTGPCAPKSHGCPAVSNGACDLEIY